MGLGACIDDDRPGAAPVFVFDSFTDSSQVDRWVGAGEGNPSPVLDGSACEVSIICDDDERDFRVARVSVVIRWVLVPSMKDRIEIGFGFDREDARETNFWIG